MALLRGLGQGSVGGANTLGGPLALVERSVIYATSKSMPTDRYTNAMQKETKSAQFMLRMRPAVKTAGEKAAQDANRSLASLMETILIDYLREKGYLPADPPKGLKRR